MANKRSSVSRSHFYRLGEQVSGDNPQLTLALSPPGPLPAGTLTPGTDKGSRSVWGSLAESRSPPQMSDAVVGCPAECVGSGSHLWLPSARASPAWKAATMPCQTSANAGHHHRAGPASDRECPCLTLRSGTYPARTRLRRPPTLSGELVLLTWLDVAVPSSWAEERSAYIPDHRWRPP
jgi:hypothetical protein